MESLPEAESHQTMTSRHVGANGRSFNIFTTSEAARSSNGRGSALVGTDYILNVSATPAAHQTG